MTITTIGIDLAKNVFQVHGTDFRGKVLLRKQLRRAQMLPFFARLEPCKVAMEACGSAHYWARKLQALGFDVMLIAPQYVKPFVKRNKNDAADAEAICVAATRPEMPTVPVKTASQQSILSIHRARQGFVKARTAQANQIRGLLAEFGFVIPQGIIHLGKSVPEIIEDGDNDLPGSFRLLILRLLDHLKVLDNQVEELEAEIVRWHRENEASKRLSEVPGIGPMTASALVASVGDARNFKNGRQLAAWLGSCHGSTPRGASPHFWALASVAIHICAHYSFMALALCCALGKPSRIHSCGQNGFWHDVTRTSRR